VLGSRGGGGEGFGLSGDGKGGLFGNGGSRGRGALGGEGGAGGSNTISTEKTSICDPRSKSIHCERQTERNGERNNERWG
jgi:hypothetical protein